MRGLAFPAEIAAFDRQYSFDSLRDSQDIDDEALDGTPIPIDPALAMPSIAVDGSSEDSGENGLAQLQEVSPSVVQQPPLGLYSQSPQGDPFAPQTQPAFFPMPQSAPPRTTARPKRKRRPRREEECGFCGGNDKKNKSNELEALITCSECGRSGHPSCLELSQIADALRTYPWSCLECKKCEICREKGDDDRILFCDSCDRGWHMDCLNPPIKDMPENEWYCPLCSQSMPIPRPTSPEISLSIPHSPATVPQARSLSAASTSRIRQSSPWRNIKIGRPIVVSTDSESSSETESEDFPSPVRQRPNRRSTKSRKKGKHRAVVAVTEGESSPNRIRKRRKSPSVQAPRIRLKLAPQSKGKEREVEPEEEKGMFDDILTLEECDTSKTSIVPADKLRFEQSRKVAEVESIAKRPISWSQFKGQEKLASTAAAEIDLLDPSLPGPSSRPMRSLVTQAQLKAASPVSSPSTPISLPATPGALRIKMIRFGQYDIKAWYNAPFPEEYAMIPDGRLWICEFCLKYIKSKFGAERHQLKCKARHPPGDEIYRDGNASIFEVDGRKNKIYCQNLCLLSKMFLDHKSLFYDVEPFLFYVMTEMDDVGARFVGYFSKEKRSPKDYNVSCIMTLPVRQRQGWGNLLIDFSYLLSKREHRTGSPEKPLSALGALGYKKYWTLAIMRYLQTAPDYVRLEDICQATSVTIEDVYNVLVQQNMIDVGEVSPPPVRPSPGQAIKVVKGRKSVGRANAARRHLQRTASDTTDSHDSGSKSPFVVPTDYDVHWDREFVDVYLANWEEKGYLKLKPEKLKWSPYILSTHAMKTQTVDIEGISELPMLSDTRTLQSRSSNSSSSSPVAGALATPKDALNDGIDHVDCTKPKTVGPSVHELFDDPIRPPSHLAVSLNGPTTPANSSGRSQRPKRRRPRSITPVSRAGTHEVTSHSATPKFVRDPSPSSTRRSRRSRGAHKEDRVEEHAAAIEADEAFAAKLAHEEEMQARRQLRSHAISGTNGNVHSMVAATPDSVRHRPVFVSRELRSRNNPETPRPLQQSVNSGRSSRLDSGQYNSGRRAPGVKLQPQLLPTLTPTSRADAQRGIRKRRKIISEEPQESVSSANQGEMTCSIGSSVLESPNRDATRILCSAGPNNIPANTSSPVLTKSSDALVSVDAEVTSETEGKAESVGTSQTGVTVGSRRSLQSDETFVDNQVAPHKWAAAVATTTTPAPRRDADEDRTAIAIAALSSLAQTVMSPANHVSAGHDVDDKAHVDSAILPAEKQVDFSMNGADGDIDAEGELDEDAEGEIDEECQL